MKIKLFISELITSLNYLSKFIPFLFFKRTIHIQILQSIWFKGYHKLFIKLNFSFVNQNAIYHRYSHNEYPLSSSNFTFWAISFKPQKTTLNIPNIIILLNLAWIDIFFSIRLLISIASFLHKISFIFTKISPFDNFPVKHSWTPFIRVISQKKIKH